MREEFATTLKATGQEIGFQEAILAHVTSRSAQDTGAKVPEMVPWFNDQD
ncbi:hypothetical protein BH11PAT4_BH11PAT4_1980 [soil metagenome]